MCQVMMEDSCWLDTYQAAILDGYSKSSKKIELLNDETLCSDSNPMDHRELSGSTEDQTVSDTLDIEELPAFEFLREKKSCVAAETFNLVKRFIPSLRKSMGPRLDLTFKKPKLSAMDRLCSASISRSNK